MKQWSALWVTSWYRQLCSCNAVFVLTIIFPVCPSDGEICTFLQMSDLSGKESTRHPFIAQLIKKRKSHWSCPLPHPFPSLPPSPILIFKNQMRLFVHYGTWNSGIVKFNLCQVTSEDEQMLHVKTSMDLVSRFTKGCVFLNLGLCNRCLGRFFGYLVRTNDTLKTFSMSNIKRASSPLSSQLFLMAVGDIPLWQVQLELIDFFQNCGGRRNGLTDQLTDSQTPMHKHTDCL